MSIQLTKNECTESIFAYLRSVSHIRLSSKCFQCVGYWKQDMELQLQCTEAYPWEDFVTATTVFRTKLNMTFTARSSGFRLSCEQPSSVYRFIPCSRLDRKPAWRPFMWWINIITTKGWEHRLLIENVVCIRQPVYWKCCLRKTDSEMKYRHLLWLILGYKLTQYTVHNLACTKTMDLSC